MQRKRIRVSYFFLMILIIGCTQNHNESIIINVWYGNKQSFGKEGIAQPFINIPGNVIAPAGILSLSYSLNDSPYVDLSTGPDLHRLASSGDFNIDLRSVDLSEGKNNLIISSLDSAGNKKSEEVEIWMEPYRQWTLPYEVIWSEVENLHDVVQVTDGKWELVNGGIRNNDIYYDRMVAFGDSTWTDYEVHTTVIFHGIAKTFPGPPTYNIAHAGFASLWNGHHKDSLQPFRQWYPVGGFAYMRVTSDFDSCRWQIEDGQGLNARQPVLEYRSLENGIKYFLKHRVESIESNKTQLSTKLWLTTQSEPEEWDLTTIKTTTQSSGGAALVAHFTQVTFGDIHVIPLNTD